MKKKPKITYLIIGLWCIILIFISYRVENKGAEIMVSRENIELEVPEGTLYGTLEIPEGLDEFPVFLVISGSGPTDRNGNSPLLEGDNNSLKMLCEGLAQQGIATLRYDKRGVGESFDVVKEVENVRFEDFINDAVMWLEKLEKDPRFNKIGVIGHSEGALIGMVAADKVNVDAYVSLAGPGYSIFDVLLKQLKSQPKEIYDEAQKIINELRKGNLVKEIRSPELEQLFHPNGQKAVMSMGQYDPAKEIGKLDIPVLITSGSTDIQVTEEDAEALYKAKPDADYKVIDGMNHVLKEAPLDIPSNIATYTDPTLPLAAGLLEEITSFLKTALK